MCTFCRTIYFLTFYRATIAMINLLSIYKFYLQYTEFKNFPTDWFPIQFMMHEVSRQIKKKLEN